MTSSLIAVVTGASRGIGKGTAIALGRAGATVYVVGRTPRNGVQTTPGGLPAPGTIDESADEVTRAGGKGIAVVADMADDAQIVALFERVRSEHGRLDILVNNAAYLSESMYVKPFWEAPIDTAHIFDVGLRCHHVATYHAAPLLIASGRGLIVNVSFFGNAHFHDPAFYATKAALDKLASVYAEDMRGHGVAAVSLWPGLTATERVLANPEVDALEKAFGLEPIEFTGQVIAALWNDANLDQLSGKTMITAELGERYNITTDGREAPRSLRPVFGGPDAAFDIAH